MLTLSPLREEDHLWLKLGTEKNTSEFQVLSCCPSIVCVVQPHGLLCIFTAYYPVYCSAHLLRCQIHNRKESYRQWFPCVCTNSKAWEKWQNRQTKTTLWWIHFWAADVFICVLHFLWLAVGKSYLYLATTNIVLKVKCFFLITELCRDVSDVLARLIKHFWQQSEEIWKAFVDWSGLMLKSF